MYRNSDLGEITSNHISVACLNTAAARKERMVESDPEVSGIFCGDMGMLRLISGAFMGYEELPFGRTLGSDFFLNSGNIARFVAASYQGTQPVSTPQKLSLDMHCQTAEPPASTLSPSLFLSLPHPSPSLSLSLLFALTLSEPCSGPRSWSYSYSYCYSYALLSHALQLPLL